MVSNTEIIFAKVPTAFPVVGEHVVVKKSNIDLNAEIPQDAILTKTLELSIDPYIRGCMRDAKTESFFPTFTVGKPMFGFTIGQVVKSNNSKFAVGDIVYGVGDFAEYALTLNAGDAYLEVRNEIKNSGIPISNYTSVLGIPGMTAYVG